MIAQSSQPQEPAFPVGALLLGEIMLEHKMIDRTQLDDALKIQRRSGKCIGETLVDMGAASWTDVTEAIREQAHRSSAQAS